MPHKAHNFRYVKKMCFVRNGDSLRLLQTVITTTRVAWGNSFLHCVSWGHCFVFVPSGLLYYNFPKNRKIHVHEVFCLKWCIYMICCWVTKLYLSLCNPMDCSTPGFSVLHCLPEFAQIHIRWLGDAIHPYYPLLIPSPPALNLPQHQGLLQWVGSLHQVAKILEL